MSKNSLDLSIAPIRVGHDRFHPELNFMLTGSHTTVAEVADGPEGSALPGMAEQAAASYPLPGEELLTGFRAPPPEFRPVPFYWWAGEPLTRERIAWQLDRLKAQGIRQVVVSYPHGTDGATEPGTPPLFSADWWELFRWFLAQ